MEARVVWDDEVAGSSPVTPTTTPSSLHPGPTGVGGDLCVTPSPFTGPSRERGESLPPPYRVRGRLQPSPVEERGESPSPQSSPVEGEEGESPSPQSSPVEGRGGGVTLTSILSRRGRGGGVRLTSVLSRQGRGAGRAPLGCVVGLRSTRGVSGRGVWSRWVRRRGPPRASVVRVFP